MKSYKLNNRRKKKKKSHTSFWLCIVLLLGIGFLNIHFLLSIFRNADDYQGLLSPTTFSSKELNDVNNVIITVPPVNLRATMREPSEELFALLPKIAINKNVMIGVFDFAFLPQFYSFYHNSILPLHITNFIAFALDKKSYEILQSWGIATILLELDAVGNTSVTSDFGTIDFINKANMKTLAVLQVLKCGYNPLLTDVDVVFFKNPFDYLDCTKCDIQIQREETSDSAKEKNSGFIYVSNTPRSYSLFSIAWQKYQVNPNLRHQLALSYAIDEMLKSKLQMKLLPIDIFSPGWYFFEEMHFVYENDLPCQECVMFHNNWILSSEAKIYRLKELGYFYTESDYYSNTKNKYITYRRLPANATIEEEEESLKTALLIAISLNRILILPRFYCHEELIARELENHLSLAYHHPKNHCTLNAFWCIRNIDKYFKEYYREHSFLKNKQVPSSVVKEYKKTEWISFNMEDEDAINLSVHSSKQLTPKRVQFLFKDFAEQQFIKLRSIPFTVKDPDWSQALEKGFKRSNYRQLECK